MAEVKSLADAAVDALAAVSRMDAGVTNEHDERHHIHTLKRLAEHALEEAFRHARDLAYLAESIREDGEQARQQGAKP